MSVNDASVTLSGVQHSLGLFAEGIVGRPVRIETLDDGDPGWPWRLSLPDHSVVRVPAEISLLASRSENRAAYRAAVLHQLAFAEFGTFIYCTDERQSQRPTDHPLIQATADPAVVSHTLVLLENLRVMAATRRRYPGAIRHIDGLVKHARQLPATDSSNLIHLLWLRVLNARPDEIMKHGATAIQQRVSTLLRLCQSLEREGTTLDDSVDAAIVIYQLLERLVPEDVANDEPHVLVDEPDDSSPEGDDEDTVHGITLNALALAAEAERASHDLGPGAETGPTQFASDAKKAQEQQAERKQTGMWWPAPVIAAGTRTFVYDEWDYVERTYRQSWCRVIEHELTGDDHQFISDVRHRHAELRAQIRRQFARLKPEDRVRAYRRDDGDELDLDAVIEAVVDRRSGVAPDDRLHVRRDRAERDVATAFLVDLSASTSSAAEPDTGPPEPFEESGYVMYPGGSGDEIPAKQQPFRRVIDIAKESVALMCDALEQLGDHHAVYGFSGTGRDNIEFHIASDFDSRTPATSWASVAAMEPRSYTRMGPAIRHASAKLAGQQAKTKLLVVISDGYPQDIDYGTVRGDRNYGLHDTARALIEATRTGVDTFCVTIDPAGHDYLRTMCPDDRYVVIDEVTSLPLELAKLYMSIAGGESWRSSEALRV